jgi:metallo-beta-lactamase family protein
VEATGIFLQSHESNFDEETLAVLRQGINPIWSQGVQLSVTAEESKLINMDPHPKVILSASGMCEAGRIRHHLKHNLWRSDSIILFVGYQAEGSMGRKLQDGVKSVKLFGEEIAVNAEICTLKGTSGHADKEGLLNWLAGFREKPRKVFVNHGDDDQCQAFRKCLEEMGYNADAPYSGTEYDLLTGKMTVYTEGKPIDRVQVFKGSQRAKQVYEELLAAAEELLRLVRKRRGMTNKENAKLTSQIRSLIEKWR